MRFKMKPLKAKNEVGSNMKSTMRYTFVAPSAIRKGRGRGLKSLDEKGNTPSKGFLPQSSDLVNKYINGIETIMVQADPSLPIIEIVEKCYGPQTRSHVFGLRGGVKAKDLKGATSSKAELLSTLCSTREDTKSLNEENKSLNEENKSLNDCLSTIEDKMKEIINMKELFVAQQSHVPPPTSYVSIE
uniref:TNP2-like transposon protein n=1 Tax=Solanum tuberosum TaxID=4113 RepID=M1DMN9_SOLTU